MKSLWTIAIAWYCCALSAHELEKHSCSTFSSEMLSLPELLSYVENTVSQLINDPDEETCQAFYYELKEGLKIIYTLNNLHPEEAGTILPVLDTCYEALATAIDTNLDKNAILQQSIELFTVYDQLLETSTAQPEYTGKNTTSAGALISAVESSDIALIYIQNNALRDVQKEMSLITIPKFSPPVRSSPRAFPHILIIKNESEGSTEYRAEMGVKWKLGGKDHGKSSGYVEGEVKDKHGNYAKGKVSKESGDDGYDCEVKGGKEKKNK